MKILLIFVTIFYIAYCRPSFDPDFQEKNVEQAFHPFLKNNEYPKEDTPAKESNHAYTPTIHAYKTCRYCHFGNVDQNGIAQYAHCRECNDKNTFNRFCYSCTRRSTDQYDAFAFCSTCI